MGRPPAKKSCFWMPPLPFETQMLGGGGKRGAGLFRSIWNRTPVPFFQYPPSVLHMPIFIHPYLFTAWARGAHKMGKTWAKEPKERGCNFAYRKSYSFLLERKHFSLLRDEKIKFGHVWRDEITKNSLCPLHPRTVGKASVRPSLRRRRVERELAAAATCGLFFFFFLLLFQPPVVQGLHGKRRRVGPKYGGETRDIMCAGLFCPLFPSQRNWL